MVRYTLGMNIFVLDENPRIAADYACDKHSVKMPLETAQMLCTALVQHGVKNTQYKPTHKSHPCTKWASENRQNFEWLAQHGIALCQTYTVRYGRTHKCQKVIEDCLSISHEIPAGELTPWPLAMKEEYRIEGSPVASYRKYYLEGKTYMNKSKGPQWKYTNPPDWYE